MNSEKKEKKKKEEIQNKLVIDKTLLQEPRLEDEEENRLFTRMAPESFNELLGLIDTDTQKPKLALYVVPVHNRSLWSAL